MASPNSPRNNSPDAAARLVEEHEVAVYSFLRTRVGSASSARALCLDVLVAVGGRGGLPSDAATLRGQVIEQAEKQLREHSAGQGGVSTIWRQACLAVDKKRGRLPKLQEHEAQRLLADLPPSQRQALQFCYGAGLSHQEIGQRMRRSEAAVRALLDKAREQFIRSSEHLPQGLPRRAAQNELTDQDLQQLNALLRQADASAAAALEELADALDLEEFLWRANSRSRLSSMLVLKRIRRRRWTPAAVLAVAACIVLVVGLYWVVRPKQDKPIVRAASNQPRNKKAASLKKTASPGQEEIASGNQPAPPPSAPRLETRPEQISSAESGAVSPPKTEDASKELTATDPWSAVLRNETPPAFLDVCFNDFFQKGGNPTRAELMKWLTPAADADGVITETRRRYGRTSLIRGVFRIKAPWRHDAGFRFAIAANGVFQIHAFEGETGLSLVQYERNGVTWAAYKTRRAKAASQPLSGVLAATDEGRANRTGALGGGPYELRWRQGRLVLSRGDVVVLAAPMERPPEDVYLAGQATVAGLELIKTADFPLLEKSPEPKSVEISPAPQWQKHLADGARWRMLKPGVWKLERPAAGANVWACAPLEQAGPYEVVLALSHFTAGGGVCLGASSAEPQLLIRFQENDRGGGLGAAIVSPRDRRLHQTFPLTEKAPAPLVGQRAWLRLVFACGVMKCWLGVDGQHWGELGAAKISGRIGWIGLHCSLGKSGCGIQLDRLALRELPNLKRLVGKDVREKARRVDADDFPQWKRQVLAQRPAEIEETQWLRASILASLSGGCESRLGHALLDALLESTQRRLAAEQRLKVLAEAALLTDFNQRGQLQALLDRYHRVGRGVLEAGQPKPFSFIRHALMTTPLLTRRVVLLGGEDLMRAELLASAAAGEWEDVSGSSRQFRFFHLEERVAIQSWAEAASLRELGARREQNAPAEKSEKRFPERWRHPGNIPIDRRAYDIAADLDSLLASKSVLAAARRIAALDFSRPLGLAPREEGLFVSPLVLTPSLLRSNESLRKAFQREAADVALLQVRQAMQDSDARRLNDLAAQFESTPAAKRAQRWLGDYALSRGAFAQARAHYRSALPRNMATGVPAAGSDDLLARLQLAGAYLEAEPPRDGAPLALSAPVRFGGKPFSQQQFDAIAEHVRRRTFPHLEKTEPTPPTRKKRFAARRFRLQSLGPLALAAPKPETNQPRSPAATRLRVTQFFDQTERGALLSSPYGLAAFNIQNNRLVWADQTFAAAGEKSAENLLAATPAVSGSAVFIRRQGRQGVLLAAYEMASGKIAWVSESSPDHQLVSDPVVVENQVIGVTAKSAPADGVELFATHWDRDSGAVVAQHKLLDLRAAPLRRLAAGLVRTPSGFLAAVGGCLIGWETEGRLLWVRRQFMAPPEDAESWRRGVAIVPYSGARGSEHFMVSQPGSPEICCVHQNTGALLWRRVFPELSAAPSKLGQTLLVRERFSIHALNQNTGGALWRRRVAERAIVLLAPAWSAVAIVTNTGEETRLEWFDANSGASQGVAAVARSDDAHLQTLFTLSGRLFGVRASGKNAGLLELVGLQVD